MNKIDTILAGLTLPDLLDIQRKIPGIIASKRADAAAELRTKMAAIAAAAGYSLADIIQNRKTKAKTARSKTAKSKKNKIRQRVDKNGLIYAGTGRKPAGWDDASAKTVS